jgi:hypothetical protein
MEQTTAMASKNRNGEPATWRRAPACGVDLRVDVLPLGRNESFSPANKANVGVHAGAAGHRPAPRLSPPFKVIIGPENSNCESS